MSGKILVVDDVASNRIILKAKLAIGCYDVIQAKDGAEAIAAVRQARPDLVLLDLAMPGMDGLEVCRRLKADPETAGIPIVVITAHADTRSRIEALRAGAEDFLTKPVDDMILAARVRSLLRARALEEELQLHEGTRQALGFAEAQAGYGGAGAARWRDPSALRKADIALVGTPEISPDGLADLLGRGAARGGGAGPVVSRLDKADCLRRVRQAAGSMAAGGRTAPAADLPEVFVIATDIESPGDGLLLLAELRASPATRHAAILMVLPPDGRASAPMALDLGASDLLAQPLDIEETGLRITTQLTRSRAAAQMRRRLRDGLQLAVTDPLTGLYNRRYALSHLDRVIDRAQSRGRAFAVMVLDLDRFKEVNDRFGHAVGDAVLKAVARRLEAALRPQDLVARIGGEEFLAILPETDRAEAQHVAERLLRVVRETPVQVLPEADGALAGGPADAAVLPPVGQAEAQVLQEIWPTVSIGLVAVAEAQEVDGASPFGGPGAAAPGARYAALADRALYAAKAAGRDRVIATEAAVSDMPRGRGGSAAA